MKKRVISYGFGKTFIGMELKELPKDIETPFTKEATDKAV